MTATRKLVSSLAFSALSFSALPFSVSFAHADFRTIFAFANADYESRSFYFSLEGSKHPTYTAAAINNKKFIVHQGQKPVLATVKVAEGDKITCTINDALPVKGAVFALDTEVSPTTGFQYEYAFVADTVYQIYMLQQDKWKSSDSPYLAANCLGGHCFNLDAVSREKVPGVQCQWHPPAENGELDRTTYTRLRN